MNEDESIWSPYQVIEWLGSIVNSSTGIFLPNERRVNKILQDLSFFLVQSFEEYLHHWDDEGVERIGHPSVKSEIWPEIAHTYPQ